MDNKVVGLGGGEYGCRPSRGNNMVVGLDGEEYGCRPRLGRIWLYA